jgi:hypothetical protein
MFTRPPDLIMEFINELRPRNMRMWIMVTGYSLPSCLNVYHTFDTSAQYGTHIVSYLQI